MEGSIRNRSPSPTLLQQTNALAKQAQEHRQVKAQENMQKTRELHAMKTQNSNAQFANTRVTSCSAVFIKNGQAVCKAFSGQNPKPIDIAAKKSSETTSFSQ